MRHSWTYLILFATTIFSCKEGAHKEFQKGSFKTNEFALIQVCVDSTLQLDVGLNSHRYLVDFTRITLLDRQVIDSFLRANPSATETNLDSLFKHDEKWKSGKFFDNPVIRFEKIIRQKDGSILINTSKTKASEAAIGTEIILKQDGQSYKCLKSDITWIS